MYGKEPTTHWCRECILASNPGPIDSVTKRIKVPIVRVGRQAPRLSSKAIQLPLFAPLRVELIGIGQALSEQLAEKPSLLYQISPEDFEEFICERLYKMGFEPQKIGPTNRKDGGIDVLFYPRLGGAFPFLGAAQVKHHRNPGIKEGPSSVREFAAVLGGHPINAGLLITNTSFTPDAIWFAREKAKLLRLRDFEDIRRWLLNNFSDEEEWREIPKVIELCPGVVVNIR
jgi:restriction endonuclease Mrr